MTVFKPVRALERGLEILATVNERDGLRTQDIADVTGLPRATAFRLLETLQGMGFVAQSQSDGAWRPTLRCNLLSSGFLDKAWVGQIAMPEMIKLGRKILWPLDLVTFAEDAMQIRETTHKISPFSFDVGMVGKMIPMLHTAGGHAYLAFCPDEERKAILEIMRSTGKPEHALAHDPITLQRILERTRARGFGYRTDGYKAHTLSISFPIFQGDRPIASLTVVCLKSAISFDEMIRKYAAKLERTCQLISQEVTRTAEARA
ncbi:helix-turn-helix domain-containing protein [Actibacterium sp.]|uniref:helix-turn-helix domain-containing protein n=1 Tax=Actibacterium sp. TaxID=1872125 RepID=UPI00356785D9